MYRKTTNVLHSYTQEICIEFIGISKHFQPLRSGQRKQSGRPGEGVCERNALLPRWLPSSRFLRHQRCCQVTYLVGKSGRSSCRRRCFPYPSNYLLNKKMEYWPWDSWMMNDDKWYSKSIVHFSQQSVSPHHSQVSHKKVLLQIMESRILHFCSVTSVTYVTSGLDPLCENLVASGLDLITTSNFPQVQEV